MAVPDSERCTAKSKQTGERCKQRSKPGFDVCHYHGGAAAEANLKPGGLSKKQLRDRNDFIEAISGKDTRGARKLVAAAMRQAFGGSEAQTRYLLDQLMGRPTTRVEVLIHRELVEHCFRVTAKHLRDEAYQAWLRDFNAGLPELLESTSSTT